MGSCFGCLRYICCCCQDRQDPTDKQEINERERLQQQKQQGPMYNSVGNNQARNPHLVSSQNHTEAPPTRNLSPIPQQIQGGECAFCDKTNTFKLNCEHFSCENCIENYILVDQEQSKCPSCSTPISKQVIHKYLYPHCLICYEEKHLQQIQRIFCSCKICKDCLVLHIRDKIDRGEVSENQLLCPGCNQSLEHSKIKNLISVELYNKYMDQLAELARNKDEIVLQFISRACPGCKALIMLRRRVEQVQCSNCDTYFCAECGKTHQGNCQNEELEGVINCPNCKDGVVREQGCNFLTCPWPKCNRNTFFCYICQKQLNKQGHVSHYTRGGPYGNSCNTVDGLPDTQSQNI